jgi:hypothetical protein
MDGRVEPGHDNRAKIREYFLRLFNQRKQLGNQVLN